MIPDPNRIYDGFFSMEAGVDAGRAANVIDPNQCVSAENMTFRGGKPAVRPAWRRLRIEDQDFTNGNHSYYEDGGDAYSQVVPGRTAKENFKWGIFQCAHAYSPHVGPDSLMVMIGGRLYRIVPYVNNARVTEVRIEDQKGAKYPAGHPNAGRLKNKRNRNTLTIAYMVQADKWFITQDGESSAILYDGSLARRAITNTTRDKTEIPVGTMMAYGMGRVCLIVNERDIAFGDLYGSHDQPDPADALVMFTERNFLAEGFDAAIPFEQGLATGLAFFPQLDTSTGNGQLLVFAQRGAQAFFLNLQRELWKESQFQIAALLTTGLRGHRSISIANEDLWFRSDDGVRSFRQARSEQYGWAHIPHSTNVRQFVRTDTNRLLQYCSSVYFDNRVLFTTSPYPNATRPFHTGAVVVDFDILSSFGEKVAKPAWDGHWTMPNNVGITQFVAGTFNGVTRAFAFVLEDDLQTNALYELTMDDRDDTVGYENGPKPKPELSESMIPITQLVEFEWISRAFDFKQESTPFTEIELYDADLWLKEIIE
jgi:hypothetical protein